MWENQQDGKGRSPSSTLPPNPIQARQQESRKEEERLVSKSPCELPHTEDTARRKVEKDAAERRKKKKKFIVT